MTQNRLNDVIVVGGGPAGLNAALVLGRCLRQVMIFDNGKPRNLKAQGVHGFISRDGVHPIELLRISREQLQKYKNIEFKAAEIYRATVLANEVFELEDTAGNLYYSRKLLIATGLVDDVPPLRNIDKFYGKSIFHCPYCDGYEMRMKPLAVYGKNRSGAGLAMALTTWSDDIILCTDGKSLSKEEKELLEMKNVQINPKKISRLDGRNGILQRIYFTDGDYIERNGMFFTTDKYQKSNIAEQLGCKFTSRGVIQTNQFQHTNVSGVFAAGDAAKDMQLVIIAAAEGARAAVIINQVLLKEEKRFLRKTVHVIKR